LPHKALFRIGDKAFFVKTADGLAIRIGVRPVLYSINALVKSFNGDLIIVNEEAIALVFDMKLGDVGLWVIHQEDMFDQNKRQEMKLGHTQEST
jgi:hypothetical protein